MSVPPGGQPLEDVYCFIDPELLLSLDSGPALKEASCDCVGNVRGHRDPRCGFVTTQAVNDMGQMVHTAYFDDTNNSSFDA